MKSKTAKVENVVFSPNLRSGDELANYWMRQATFRLRREIAWLWHERGPGVPQRPGELPPVVDRASDSLDLSRHWNEKQDFFSNDVAARYLSEQLAVGQPADDKPTRGSFGWVARELELDHVSCFTLGLGLASAFDASFGAVIGSCLNDNGRIYPNLLLVQRLWDQPEEVMRLSDPMHPLFSHGLITRSAAAQRHYPETLFEQPLTVPSLVARALLSEKNLRPAGVTAVEDKAEGELSESNRIIAYRLRSEKPSRLRVVPLLGNRRSAFRQMASALQRVSERKLWEYSGDPSLLGREDYLNMLVTLAWLADRDLFVSHELFSGPERARERNEGLPHTSVPITLFVPVTDHKQLSHIDPDLLLPLVKIHPLTYEQRLAAWNEGFAKKAARYAPILAETARRFRFERSVIAQICRELQALAKPPTEDDFIAACRAELNFDIGELAAFVEPRFIDEKLILPHKQDLQFEEQLAAMTSLTKVHYGWGTARAWNEGGITVLFAGPPGTGKTMAAEVMAHRLKLPMYRIDLSQVVNKYIGETEKNLKRIFDAADISDMVLFFDEADALFGKRTDVSDSRDRYANLEISYLLERVERFKGLAILATNRKNDLDHAFLRRIRHIIDFPVPDEEQRAQMWQQMIPQSVADNSHIDISFLARQFPLSGGHIRSIVFNACLQSAHSADDRNELFMRDILVAVKREYDKMNRSLSLNQLGAYASDIAALE
jgi:hypothetical protein